MGKICLTRYMSEIPKEGFDIYSIPGMDEAILELTEEYGVEQQEAEQGVRLAMSMHAILYDYKKPKNIRDKVAMEKEVKRLYAQAAESVPGIEVDNHSRPLPRYRYVASDILGTILDEDDALYGYFATIKDAPMVPNFAKAKEVIDTLVPLLQNNEFPYNQARFVLPENPEHMPKAPFKDDREEANFYLTACLWMRRTDSNKAMRDLGRAFDDTRGMERDPFDPATVATMTPEEVAGIFGKYPQLRMLKGNAPGLIHNMRFLNARFGGDIRNAYADTDDFDEVVSRLKNSPHQNDPSLYMPEFGKGMYGFGKKMISMQTYYLIEAEKIPPIDYPPPIDQHLAKLTAGTGSVFIAHEFRDENYMTEYLQDVVRDLYYDHSLRYGVSTNDIAKALWLLGSKNCSQSPATFTKVIKSDARKSVFGDYEHGYHRNGFDTVGIYATCLSCPLHTTGLCTDTARGKENHLKGQLILVERSGLPNPADYAVFDGDPEWETLTAATAAAARNKADKRRIKERRPAYQQERNGSPQLITTNRESGQHRLF